MIRVAPSVLACDFSRLGEEVEKVEKAGADLLHLDVMDGMFVPNISFGPDVISSIRKKSGLVFDVHLMIEDPGRYIARFAACGADIITIHYESCDNQRQVLEAIKSAGKIPSVSIKPATPAFVLEPLLPYVKMVLVMTVEPGFGGQKFIPASLRKISEIRNMIKKSGRDIRLQVDGGVTEANAQDVIDAGADVLVAGSAVFSSRNPKATILNLRCGR